MKNILRIFVLLGILSFGLISCSDDDGRSLNDLYYNFGTVEFNDAQSLDNFDIRLDSGSWLVLTNGNAAAKYFKDQDRLMVVYTIIGDLDPVDGYKRYLAILQGYRKLLNKQPVTLSFIQEDEQHRQDSIGSDPIKVDDAWFGGKYLNINFSVAVERGSKEVHFINLVADDVDYNGGVMNLYLRHNGYDDVPAAGATNFGYGKGTVSFDLTGLIPDGAASLDIVLHWTEYENTSWSATVDKKDDGTFVPYRKPVNEPSTDSVNFEGEAREFN